MSSCISTGISAIYILDHKGRVLITRCYKGDLPINIHDIFNKKLLEYDEFSVKPILRDKYGHSFFYLHHNNLIFLAISRKNTNCMMVFSFLYQLIQVLVDYFKELEEESVRDNFVIIYELLDEMMDNGYPQTTDNKILKGLIKTESHELKKDQKKPSKNSSLSIENQVDAITGAVTWRNNGISYKKNEVFLDVIEKLNMLVSHQGNVIKSEIAGQIRVRCFLSGMPELKLGINDKAFYDAQGRTSKSRAIEFDDMKFHACVRLSKFENDRVISFIPPDGEFELASYRLDVRVKPLFSVEVTPERKPNSNKIEFTVKVKSNFKQKSTANNVEIFIPVPDDAETPVFKAAYGTVEYVAEKEAMGWKFKQFPGQREYMMTATFHLPTVVSPNREKFQRMPISINFEIPYYTVSGFQVRYLKIQEKSGYHALPWVRYITQNGDYQIRMS
nr:Apm1Ap [Tetrahymena thermophila]